MKETDVISRVFGVSIINKLVIVFTWNKELKALPNIYYISLEEFYLGKSYQETLIYQTKKSGAVFALSKDLCLTEYEGKYGISNAFGYKNGFAVTSLVTKTYHYFDLEAKEVKDLGFYFDNSGNFGENYLFKRMNGKITVFFIPNKTAVRIIDVKLDFDAPPINAICYNNLSIFITHSNGQLLSVDVKSGQLNWKQEGVGKLVTYKDEIYCLTAHSLKEFELKILDAKTGNVIRNKMVNNLDAEFGFRPTGHIKVYEEFIFCLSTQKPGMVCVFRRNTLEFYKIIVLEESIPNNLENVHWHKNKLYILTQDHTLHIFEKE